MQRVLKKLKRNIWTSSAAVGLAVVEALVGTGDISPDIGEKAQMVLLIIGLLKARDGKAISPEVIEELRDEVKSRQGREGAQ